MPRPFFTVHDYGMGSTHQFIVADSAEQIEEAFSQLHVFSELPTWAEGQTGGSKAHTLGDGHDPFLRELTTERASLGALFGVRGEFIRVAAHYELPDGDLPAVTYLELDAQRWTTRQVEVFADGRTERRDEKELSSFVPARTPSVESINGDPTFVAKPISCDEFEEIWSTAGAVAGHDR